MKINPEFLDHLYARKYELAAEIQKINAVKGFESDKHICVHSAVLQCKNEEYNSLLKIIECYLKGL